MKTIRRWSWKWFWRGLRGLFWIKPENARRRKWVFVLSWSVTIIKFFIFFQSVHFVIAKYLDITAIQHGNSELRQILFDIPRFCEVIWLLLCCVTLVLILTSKRVVESNQLTSLIFAFIVSFCGGLVWGLILGFTIIYQPYNSAVNSFCGFGVGPLCFLLLGLFAFCQKPNLTFALISGHVVSISFILAMGLILGPIYTLGNFLTIGLFFGLIVGFRYLVLRSSLPTQE